MGSENKLRYDKHADLKKHVDDERVLAAIRTLESETSGTIHVSVAKHIRGKTIDAAARAFQHLGYASRNSAAVLFFIVPSRRELSVIGGEAVHARLGDAYWRELVAAILQRVGQEGLTAGLIHGIEDVGRQLARLFPKAIDHSENPRRP